MPILRTVIGLSFLAAFIALFVWRMNGVLEKNKPKPQTPHELYLEQKYKRERIERGEEEEDIGYDDGDTYGPQDNRGHSDF